MTFVLDNSVAMRWFFENAVHPYAESVLQRLSTGEDAVVPVLWFYEASAVLSRAESKGSPETKVREFILQLQALNIRADNADPALIFTNVHRLAVAHRLTSYDAAYLELALRLGLPLATLDNDLIRASMTAGVTLVP